MSGAAPGQAALVTLTALLDEVLDDVEHVVDGNAEWIDRDMLNDYSERMAEAVAAAAAEVAEGAAVTDEEIGRVRPAPGLHDGCASTIAGLEKDRDVARERVRTLLAETPRDLWPAWAEEEAERESAARPRPGSTGTDG